MRHSKYINAASVLAPDLLDAVCEAVNGKPCFLWVPACRRRGRIKRDRAVLALTACGYPAQKIAVQLFISVRTVRRILAKARALGAPSDLAPGQGQRKPDLQKGG